MARAVFVLFVAIVWVSTLAGTDYFALLLRFRLRLFRLRGSASGRRALFGVGLAGEVIPAEHESAVAFDR